MRLRNLLIAAALLLCLSGAVWYANRHPKSATPDADTVASTPKLADISASDVVQIDLMKKDAPVVTLKRVAGKWAITAPEALPADQDAVTSMLSNLSPVSADAVVNDTPGDVTQYGLNPPALVVKVYQKNGKTQQFLFGSNLVVGSSTYLRVNSDPKVYSVPASIHTAFDKNSGDLRDKRLLPFDQSKLTSVDVASDKGDLQFAKNSSGDWQIVKPQPYRADSSQVDDLVRKLGDAKMDSSVSPADAQKAASAYAAGSGVAVVKVTDNSGTHTLQVRKNGSDSYGRSDAVTGFYKLASDLGTQLTKPIDDYRNKKLFDFGFSDLSKVTLEQGGSTKTYTRSGSDWKASGAKVDVGKVQAFIDKLRDATATGFLKDAMPPTTITISVTPDNKSTETVGIAKTANGYAAQRAGDPAVYGLDGPTVEDMLRAAGDIKNVSK